MLLCIDVTLIVTCGNIGYIRFKPNVAVLRQIPFKGKVMTDELQAEAVAPVENDNLNEQLTTEPPEQGSESAPDTGENQEPKIVLFPSWLSGI